MASKKVIPFEKSFASCDKAKYWHKEKNGDVRPEDITIRTGTKYWFICNNIECRHDFLTSPDKIASGNWCQFCCNPPQKLCDDGKCNNCLVKSFASLEKAIDWSDKNELKPYQVFKSCNSKFWFNCNNCAHEFNSALSSITGGSFCPYCANKKLCDVQECQKCLLNSFASDSKAQYWNYEKNGDLQPRNIFKYCNNKYYFNCSECQHVFDIALNNIRVGRWCPFCANKQLCNDNACQWCFNNSFASHEKSKLWSEKNGLLTPRKIAKCSSKKFWFKCQDCTHEFETNISHIVRTGNDKFCPICSSQYLCDNKECKICFGKSFASHPKFVYLDKEKHKDVNFRMIFKNCNRKFWFNCNCGHDIEMTLNSVASGSWCSYCCIPQLKLCENEDCKHCFEKSFASHPRIKYIDESEKNTNFRFIFKGSDKKFNFKCENGHIFQKQISCITSKLSTWCPKCTNKTEKKLYEELSKIYPELLIQYRADWCKNEDTKCYLPFDYVLEDKKIIIELDGKQHFIQVKNWAKPEETRIRDKLKMKKANDNGYSVIRILQVDVNEDKYNWLDELKANIDKVISKSKVQNIYMCKKDEYKVYEE
jgi:hypothetical protein